MGCRIAIADDAWLRPLAVGDAEVLHALVAANRDHLSAWLPWAATQTLAGTAAYIAAARERAAANDGFQTVILSGGAIVGSVGFHAVDWSNRATSIGYWLSAEAQGRGLMTASVRALTDHAFGGWRLNRVTIEAAVGNARSRAVPERLGYRQEGILRESQRVGGRYHDGVLYAVLAAEWPRSAPEAIGSA